MDIVVNDEISIPERELLFTASRSSGPGGQHVNKVSSRVTLHFNLRTSPTLTSHQKQRIAARLARRITRDGVLQLHAQRHRSQSANRADLVDRFVMLLQESLRARRPRVPTKVPKAARDRRLRKKKIRGQVKKGRSSAIVADS